ncbi:rabenosyn-5 [Trichonephila inaurata madagascariensis]|uniref:Rabenosyn-5 n=1 Tax=Trichonephila inaurata madagascariensis TaxID=2747483 RepID=A0A8X7CJ53_9ARAC|nr:rabenosyn-5 [Trichonephila inaurata madagascariensis]
MAKSASGITEGEIREGLLCPICMYDLHTVDQLQEHFELNHSSEDTDVIQALKGFFDKAKRKILKQDTLDNDFSRPFEAELVCNFKPEPIDMTWEEQDIGLISSHTQYFKKFRDKKINRFVIETNKLLIRLDKLICDISSDPEKKKEFEKSIVPWVADSDVPLCPGCAKSFGLSRRWHHCRLCGYVMCNSCSFFISYDFARKLTLPAISDDQCLLQKSSPVFRKGSAASLMSVVNIGSDHHLLRICKDCNLLLQRHEKMLDLKNHRPVIVQIYERLREGMNEVEKLVPQYIEMIESLNSGETDYQLQDAQTLKLKITKLAEKIDVHSKRIAKLEPTEEESSNRAIQLQSGIRMAASQFLRNAVLSLPSPPTQEELARYQSMRLDQVHRRIQLEKEAEMLRNQKENSKSPSPVKTPTQKFTEPVTPDTGWCVSTDTVKEEEDPMIQQINIIHNYIKQARLDHKYDEVKMLENNLKELQLEHSRQKAKNY